MAISTREQILDAAEGLFAARGFYGASLAGIAADLGITKQALLHHFGKKEKLYGEMLARLSAPMVERVRQARLQHREPADQLEAFFIDYVDRLPADVDLAQILMRELLDNRERAGSARSWYLRPFLDELVAIARELPAREPIDEPRAFAFVYSMLGAIHYFAVSQPTLAQMYGRRRYAAFRKEMAVELQALVRARVASLVG